MTHLTAEKRLDKNGRWVTKHVRSGARGSAGGAIPSPSLTRTPEHPRKAKERAALAKRIKSLDKVRVRTLNRKKTRIYASWRLEKFYKESYKFSASDNDFYTVLEKLPFGDAVVLMNAGLRADQVDEFLEKNRYDAVDNSALVAELRARGVGVAAYVAVQSSMFVWPDNAVDAAETYHLFSNRNYGPDYYARTQYVDHVGCENISVNDIKAVGVDRCNRDFADFHNLLNLIRNGQSACTAAELGEMLDRFDERFPEDVDDRTLLAVRSRAGVKYGIDLVEGIEDPMSFYYAEEHADKMEPEKAKDFLLYSDRAGSDEPIERYDDSDKWRKLAVTKKTLWESGIDVEAAREGIAAGMSAEQIIGVHQHGITASMSSGWL